MPVTAVVFDLFGTLLAVEGMGRAVAAAGVSESGAFVLDWRRKQLEYAFISSLGDGYRDFDDVTALALDYTCAQRGVALDEAVRTGLVDAWRTMPAYDDVAPALHALAARNIARAVLTNGTPATADAALRNAGVRDVLTDVLSVDAVRAYKPDARVYTLATQRFACAPRDIVFVSSNGWDAWGAARFGFRVAWCNRAGNAAETLTPHPRTTLKSLSELGAFVEAQ
ncbi:MAG: haloacid dehalogenase type II [Candidatus Elarobacter sp.]